MHRCAQQLLLFRNLIFAKNLHDPAAGSRNAGAAKKGNKKGSTRASTTYKRHERCDCRTAAVIPTPHEHKNGAMGLVIILSRPQAVPLFVVLDMSNDAAGSRREGAVMKGAALARKLLPATATTHG